MKTKIAICAWIAGMFFLPQTTFAYVFNSSLDIGNSGPDVSALQESLRSLGFFSYPQITGYFGPVTQVALRAFQQAEGIVSSGTPATTGYGSLGPRTRAALNVRRVTTSVDAVSPSIGDASSSSTFVRSLGLGAAGGDVRALQEFLNRNGFPIAATGAGSLGNETNVFGPLTRSALVRFQVAQRITPTGFFGPVTRTKVSELSRTNSGGGQQDSDDSSSESSNERRTSRSSGGGRGYSSTPTPTPDPVVPRNPTIPIGDPVPPTPTPTPPTPRPPTPPTPIPPPPLPPREPTPDSPTPGDLANKTKIFVDNSLAANCAGKTYSMTKRNCTGNDGAAYTTLQKAADVVGPGEYVLVREGVYTDTGMDLGVRGKVTVAMMTSGTVGSPITFMAYPGETAVLEGAELLSGWRLCTSQADCKGNPNWRSIYVTDAPAGMVAETALLFEGDKRLTVAQDPEPESALYWDQPSTWRAIPSAGYTVTTIKDTAYFTQNDPNYWVGSYVHIWSCNNNVMLRKVTGYNPATATISFEPITCPNYLRARDKYAMWNHASLISNRGEFYVDESDRKIYLWPQRSSDINTVAVAVRGRAVDFRGQDYIVVDGFTIRGFHNEAISNYLPGSHHLTVKNNTLYNLSGRGAIFLSNVSNTTADNNTIYEVQGAGIHMSNGSDNVISNNKLTRVGSTGLRFYTVTDGAIINNENIDSRGQHANGITVYLHSNGIEIKGNTIINSNIALTTQDSINLTITDNYFEAPPGYSSAVAAWGGLYQDVRQPYNYTFKNNIVRNGQLSIYEGFENVIVTDNILHGLDTTSPNLTHRNNLYAKLSWVQKYNLADHNESLYENESLLFKNLSAGDFRVNNRVLGVPPVNPCTMSSTGGAVGFAGCSDPSIIVEVPLVTPPPAPVPTPPTTITNTSSLNSSNVDIAAPRSSSGGDLVLHLTFDSSSISGATVTDASGLGNRGTLVNAPTAVSGRYGNALSFNGANYVDLGTGSLGLDQVFTVSMWVKKGDGNTLYHPLITRGRFVEPFALQYYKGVDSARMSTRSAATVAYRNAGAQFGSGWNLVTMVYANGSRKLYVNGSLSAEDAVAGSLSWGGSGNLTIGGDTSSTKGFIGAIDDVRIYKRALSASDVSALYQGTFARGKQNGMVAGVATTNLQPLLEALREFLLVLRKSL